LTSLFAVVVVLLSVSLAAMTIVLFVIAPVQGQAQQNLTKQTTIKTEGLNANSLDIQNIPLKKVHVGDIDVAYKMFGNGDPILLIQGLGGSMDSWEPSTLKELSSNHTVIIFNNRGVGNTTTGTRPFSVQRFANDTVGLLDGMKIQKADVMGHSMGLFIAQQLAITHPEKVNRLILVSSMCGGKESIPPSPENLKLAKKFISSIVKNTLIEPQEIKTVIALSD
jgi:alpha-beta hydrolase superfamily lysophospholipase